MDRPPLTVATIDNLTMVVGGPGSGKTRFVSHEFVPGWTNDESSSWISLGGGPPVVDDFSPIFSAHLAITPFDDPASNVRRARALSLLESCAHDEGHVIVIEDATYLADQERFLLLVEHLMARYEHVCVTVGDPATALTLMSRIQRVRCL